MEKISRRDFVQSLGGGALMALARSEPDLILYNGNIWTVDAKNPLLRAMLSIPVRIGCFMAATTGDEPPPYWPV